MKDSETLLTDLLEYHHVINQEIIDHLHDHSEKMSEEAHDLISHTLVAHQTWNNRIDHSCEAPFTLQKIIPLNLCSQIDTQNYQNSIKILSSKDFDKKITYKNSKGIEFTNSVTEILSHISNHTSHHRGQLMAELKSCGIPTTSTDYIFYKRK
jgi:uncharacterized damage-inducible protein DinB